MFRISFRLKPLSLIFFGGLLLSACASNTFGGGLFSYSKDRCLGGNNQCRNECSGADNGPVEAACIQRCLDRQSQCYAMGDDGRGSSLSQESLIGYARSEEEKEAEFRAYQARKARERIEAAASEPENQDTPPENARPQ